jgi:hypothetical protein
MGVFFGFGRGATAFVGCLEAMVRAVGGLIRDSRKVQFCQDLVVELSVRLCPYVVVGVDAHSEIFWAAQYSATCHRFCGLGILLRFPLLSCRHVQVTTPREPLQLIVPSMLLDSLSMLLKCRPDMYHHVSVRSSNNKFPPASWRTHPCIHCISAA